MEVMLIGSGLRAWENGIKNSESDLEIDFRLVVCELLSMLRVFRI